MSQRLGEPRTVAAFAALRFDELGNECPSAPIEVALYSRTLCFQTKAAEALLARADPQVRDEFALCHSRTPYTIQCNERYICVCTVAMSQNDSRTKSSPRSATLVEREEHNPHMLRNACGYALANRGHDTRALQAYLGHKNIQHTGSLHRTVAEYLPCHPCGTCDLADYFKSKTSREPNPHSPRSQYCTGVTCPEQRG